MGLVAGDPILGPSKDMVDNGTLRMAANRAAVATLPAFWPVGGERWRSDRQGLHPLTGVPPQLLFPRCHRGKGEAADNEEHPALGNRKLGFRSCSAV